MPDLNQKLIQYCQSNIYPFHMPGHKQTAIPFPNPYSIDITEIDGFDNLHHAENILKETQERAAALYGAKCSYYLVNGSTCGVLAAICAATRKRDKVLVARNCHKAVYHALFLNELQTEYLYPVLTNNDLQGQITVEQVEEALYHNPDITAVIITSPTYEGIISDVAGIAETAHAHGVPLIVDEAHGAHIGFGAGFPENAVKLGADAVIMSLHKTLPSFTQTALLHINSNRIAQEQVESYLDIFETSSPSYLLMAGMDACIRLLQEEGKVLFTRYRELLDQFYRDISDLELLHVMSEKDLGKEEAYDWDDSKIVIFTGKADMTGEKLGRILLDRYHLQMEMLSGTYVLGMTSIMDRQEGFTRLSKALHEIDRDCMDNQRKRNDGNSKIFIERMYQKNRREMQIYQARELSYKEVKLEEAVGKMAADSIFIYPPGIPMIVPGEIISRQFIENVKECIEMGLKIEGLANLTSRRIKIVYF